MKAQDGQGCRGISIAGLSMVALFTAAVGAYCLMNGKPVGAFVSSGIALGSAWMIQTLVSASRPRTSP